MSMATRTEMRSPALHVADSHDRIRVHGARVNNLKDVTVEIPKRRLTVFTGVSGSGKSSLVFSTIAAESQRLINETYSAFVQGFMPTLARPEVDLLEGLTTAIIVDQERRGVAVVGSTNPGLLQENFRRAHRGPGGGVCSVTEFPRYGVLRSWLEVRRRLSAVVVLLLRPREALAWHPPAAWASAWRACEGGALARSRWPRRAPPGTARNRRCNRV